MTTKPADSDPRFHGRRRGRKLRPGRERLLETFLPEVSLAMPVGEGAVDPHRLLPGAPAETWLEIGFGAGEHLAWQAAQNPEIGMIGAEPFLNGVARLLAEIQEQDLTNIRVLPDDVRPVLARFDATSLSRVFILFPDPWPKLRHHRRRIVNPDMLDELARVMIDGAELRLATDDQSYLVWILRHLHDHAAFEWLAEGASDWNTRPVDWPDTRYESKNRSGGPGPTFLRYRRRPRSGV
jgi:tRNA (guanine-N7-)-methyltransferase